MKNEDKLTILLIGPLPPPLGGTTVSFHQLVKELRAREDIELNLIDTSRKRSEFIWLDSISVGFKTIPCLFKYARRADVITLHSSSGGAFILGPVVHWLSRLFGKPWILSMFGGSADQYFRRQPRLIKIFMGNTTLSADLSLFQTHQLVDFFRKWCKHNLAWYSNSRSMDEKSLPKPPRTHCRRFVFIGHVKPSKGIREIIAAGEQLDSGITVDIYGPLMDGISVQDFAKLRAVRYFGVLHPEHVIPTLQGYDALLLPTYYKGEGYPGVILEAYAAGLPVISTKWKAIPEIVDESSGILVEPKDGNQLLWAMQRLIKEPAFYQALCKGVLRKRMCFSSTVWSERFVSYCRSVARAEH